MIYFCADDYGLSDEVNERIETCFENGVLNKISVLPNGKLDDFNTRLSSKVTLSLHLNLVEGYCFSEPSSINLLTDDKGRFRYSFIGLFFLCFSPERKKVEKQLYEEIRAQVKFWKSVVGDKAVSIDSHQHTHMIPLVFKTLLKVIKDENLEVSSLRIPAEPISPYILTPSLYFTYSVTGLVKQWLLRFLTCINFKRIKKSKIDYSYFMGVLFSGNITETKIKKLLPRYLKLAEKNKKDIEIGIHPGYVNEGEKLICGTKKGFCKFYFSPLRKKEYDTLINFKF